MARPLHAAVWLTLALCALSYVLPFPYFERLNNPNENVRVYMTRAIVDYGTMSIDPVVAEWGYVNDKAIFDGRLYPGKAPGTSFLAVPAYWLYSWTAEALEFETTKAMSVYVCRVGSSLVPCLIFLWVFALALSRVTHMVWLQCTGLVCLGIGSTFFPYAMLAASHSCIAACLFGAFIAVERHRREPDPWWPPVLAGLLMGAAVAMEYPAALAGVIVGFHGLFRSSRPLRYCLLGVAGAIAPILLLITFHMQFGGPLQTAYNHLENPEFVEHVSGGFMGMERVQPAAIRGSFVAPNNGLFWFMPWSVLSVLSLGLGFFNRGLRPTAITTFAILIAYGLFISMVHNWRGGWTSGPRYIMPVIPFLVWWLVRAAHELMKNPDWIVPTRWLLMATIVPAAFCCGLAATVFPHFPEELFNPVWELGLYMPLRGYLPASVFALADVDSDALSWITLLMPALAALVGLTITGRSSRGLQSTMTLAAGLLAGSILVQLMSLPQSGPQLTQSRTFVAGLWPNPPNDTVRDLRLGSLPSELVNSRHPGQLRRHAGNAAAAGYDQTALDLLHQAWLLDQLPAHRRRGQATVPPEQPPVFAGPLPESPEGSGGS
jgi:hypothetical protein